MRSTLKSALAAGAVALSAAALCVGAAPAGAITAPNPVTYVDGATTYSISQAATLSADACPESGAWARGLLYLADYCSGDVAVINPTANSVSHIPLAGQSWGWPIAASPSGDRVYVNDSSGTAVIDTATKQVTSTISVASADAVAVSPTTGTVYVIDGSGDLHVLDPAHLAEPSYTGTTVSLGSGFRNVWKLVVSPDGKTLYAPNGSSLDAFRTADLSLAPVSATLTGPSEDLALSPDGKTAYVPALDGSVDVLDTSALASYTASNLPLHVPAGANPYSEGISPDGRLLYVSLYDGDGVAVLDTQHLSAYSASNMPPMLPNSDYGYGVFVSPDSTAVYVENEADAANGDGTPSLTRWNVSARATPTVRDITHSTPTVGDTVTASAGTWLPAAVHYQWLANGAAIAGATGSSFKITSAQAGKAISVRVSNSAYAAGLVSKATAGVAPAHLTATPTPKITGKAKVGKTLTAHAGTWAPGPVTLKYQWYAGAKKISGATHRTLKLTKAWRGKKISVRVTGTKLGYVSVTKASTATAKVK